MLKLLPRSVFSLAIKLKRLVLPPCALSIVPKRPIGLLYSGIVILLPLASIAGVLAAMARSGISPDALQVVVKADALNESLLLALSCLVYLLKALKRL